MPPKREKKRRGDSDGGGGGDKHAELLANVFKGFREAKESSKIHNDPKNLREIHMRNFNYYRNLPLDTQIHEQLMPLFTEGILGVSFYEPIITLTIEEKIPIIRESVGRFIRQGDLLLGDLKAHLGRWDPDLKAGAAVATEFGSNASLIFAEGLVEFCYGLEAACLAGNDPVEIYSLFWKVKDLYERLHFNLSLVMILVKGPDAPSASSGANSSMAFGIID